MLLMGLTILTPERSRTRQAAWHEVCGAGPVVVLLHDGFSGAPVVSPGPGYSATRAFQVYVPNDADMLAHLTWTRR
jgi:hypothetical protein